MEKIARLEMMNITDKLPQSIVLEILSKLDLESLCSSAPVCRSLRSSVSLSLSSLSSLDLTEFPPSMEILNSLMRNNRNIQSLMLDCSRLDDSSIHLFSKERLQELVLLKCFKFSSYIFTAIGEKCPKLRLLTLEVIYQYEVEPPHTCMKAIDQMLNGCLRLESLHIKFLNQCPSPNYYKYYELILPKSIKTFLLQSISSQQAMLLIPMCCGLQSLTLVLDGITDELLVLISRNLQNLTELCLEDRPWGESSLYNDLSNNGILALCFCRNLKRLSLTRSKVNFSSSFKRVNDIGVLHLAEKLKQLEEVRLAGFSKVTDAGYTSILHSCKNLRRFEIVNAYFLSDLAFHDLVNAPSCLAVVRLISCSLLTSDTAESLSHCENLEVLDLSNCKSIADRGLSSISKLCKLTTLDLSGADITDSGLSALGMCGSPISSLSLRGCKRITNRGMYLIFHGENSNISKTLTTLDLGYMPGISDRAVAVISEFCTQLTSLCIRHCFFVSDVAIKVLGSRRRAIRRLDLYNCCALSVESFDHLSQPNFSGLRWLGVGNTRLCGKGKERLLEISRIRPGLSVCASGCEMRCDIGWKFHEYI